MFLKGAFNFSIGNVFQQCFILNQKHTRVSVSIPSIEYHSLCMHTVHWFCNGTPTQFIYIKATCIQNCIFLPENTVARHIHVSARNDVKHQRQMPLHRQGTHHLTVSDTSIILLWYSCLYIQLTCSRFLNVSVYRRYSPTTSLLHFNHSS